MSKENIFISPPLAESKIVQTPKECLSLEIDTDISVFSPEIRILLERRKSNQGLDPEEQKTFDLAVYQWWMDKYGFSFVNKTARDEVLARKYLQKKDIDARKDIQTRLFQAIAEKDEEKLATLKREYIEVYPDQLEGVEVLFGIGDFFEKQKEFNRNGDKLDQEERMKMFRDFTEYQFLFTHFILLNNNDREFMELFWIVSFNIAKRMKAVRIFNILRRGQISQVAVYKIVESVGGVPKLAHPDEDAFSAVDLWTSEGDAIQIKGWDEEVPTIIDSDLTSFPAVGVNGKEHKAHFFSSLEFLKSKNRIFWAKIKKYGEHMGRDISGHMLVVPYSKIDFVTGEPDPALIDFFREEIKKRGIDITPK